MRNRVEEKRCNLFYDCEMKYSIKVVCGSTVKKKVSDPSVGGAHHHNNTTHLSFLIPLLVLSVFAIGAIAFVDVQIFQLPTKQTVLERLTSPENERIFRSNVMGSSQSSSSFSSPPLPNVPLVSELLEANPIDWEACHRSLQACPEQAFLYAHGGVEPSIVWKAIARQAPHDFIRRLLEIETDENEDSMMCCSSVLDQVAPQTQSTLLHLAASHATDPNVLALLLQKRPQLAMARDVKGRIPLHVCCADHPDPVRILSVLVNEDDTDSSSSSSSSRTLLSARTSLEGALPLHLALTRTNENEEDDEEDEYAKDAQLASLLPFLVPSTLHKDAAKSILLARTKRGQSSLHLLIQRLRLLGRNQNKNNIHPDLYRILQDWIRIVKQDDSIPMLHANIQYGTCVTLELMQHALKTYPIHNHNDNHNEKSSLYDTQGRTPLHMVALYGQESCQTDALEYLIQANPKAPRMTDDEGRLPIDIAAESSTSWTSQSWRLLIQGEPRAVHTRDLARKMYPFVTSAFSHQSNLNNTYTLLRSHPEVLSYYHTS